MRKPKTFRHFGDEATAPPQTCTPQQVFEIAKRKVFAVHTNLFRRLAEYDRQKDARKE